MARVCNERYTALIEANLGRKNTVTNLPTRYKSLQIPITHSESLLIHLDIKQKRYGETIAGRRGRSLLRDDERKIDYRGDWDIGDG